MAPQKIKGVSNGWVKYEANNEEYRSLRVSGLLSDKFESKYGLSIIWLPRWVRDAVRIFKKNGFAGLSLTEYLLAIKPEETDAERK
jgi:hypothetical protein